MGRTIKRKNTRSRKTRRHRGGFGQEQPVVPVPVPPPASPALFQPTTQIQPVKPCGWWGSLFGCPKTTTGGRRKKSVSFRR